MKLCAAALVLAALPAQAQMYKCVDQRGVTQYTDEPRAGCKAVDIRPSPPLSGAVQPRSDDFAVQDAELRRRQIEREALAAKEREQQRAFEQRCARLREDERMLSSGIRILVGVSPGGEQLFLDDATREQRLGEVREGLRACR